MRVSRSRRCWSALALCCAAIAVGVSAACAQDYSTSVRTQPDGPGRLPGFLNSPGFRGFLRSTVESVLERRTPETHWASAPTGDLPLTPASPPLPPARMNIPSFQAAIPATGGALSRREVEQLARRDIRILLDKSGSMSEKDCPSPFSRGPMSRWDWCRWQTSSLTNELGGVHSQGITVVPFSNRAERYTHVGTSEIARIFAMESPSGGTNLAGALRGELDHYFQERDYNPRVRPLLLAIVTDGVPSNKGQVKHLIKEATQKIARPDEIRIVFVTVGNDREGANFLYEVDNLMYQEGARADIVEAKSFGELLRFGLPRTLAGI